MGIMTEVGLRSVLLLVCCLAVLPAVDLREREHDGDLSAMNDSGGESGTSHVPIAFLLSHRGNRRGDAPAIVPELVVWDDGVVLRAFAEADGRSRKWLTGQLSPRDVDQLRADLEQYGMLKKRSIRYWVQPSSDYRQIAHRQGSDWTQVSWTERYDMGSGEEFRAFAADWVQLRISLGTCQRAATRTLSEGASVHGIVVGDPAPIVWGKHPRSWWTDSRDDGEGTPGAADRP